MSDIISLTGGHGAMNRIGIFFICSNGEIIANHIPYKKGRFLNGLYDSKIIGSCSTRLFLSLIQMIILMYPEEELFLMNETIKVLSI